jgi:hypothetical protein
MMLDVIGWFSKEPQSMFTTPRLAAREGKKADDGTMSSSLDVNPTTVADPTATQTLPSATTTEVLGILMKRN